MSNTFGQKLKITIFGESHGPSIGVVIEGLPPGISLDMDFIKHEMKRRAPGQNNLSTPRKEKDEFIIQSGYFNQRTTGQVMTVIIPNTNTHSKDYSLLKDIMRPSHGDYPGNIKYEGYNDYRGGGSFSGRLTAPLVFAGSIAKLILKEKGIRISSHIKSIKDVEDVSFNPLGEDDDILDNLLQKELPVINDEVIPLMRDVILRARENKDSVGGRIETIITNLPVGLGNPFFDSLESRLAHGMFSIPSVKGIEFGKGFNITKLFGSEANDEMYIDTDKSIKTYTNNNGGILGGLSNGMPVVFSLAIKPTPSIGQEQNTINIKTLENTKLKITGRHDPCIVQRAVPVVESMAAIVVLDEMLINNKI